MSVDGKGWCMKRPDGHRESKGGGGGGGFICMCALATQGLKGGGGTLKGGAEEKKRCRIEKGWARGEVLQAGGRHGPREVTEGGARCIAVTCVVGQAGTN